MFFLCCPERYLQKKILSFRFNDMDQAISPDIMDYYADIKRKFKKLQKEFPSSTYDCESSPFLMKDILNFYFKSETLILILLNEMFQKNFVETIESKKPIFDLLNKLMKIFISFDILKKEFADVFCQYSFYKLYYKDQINKIFTESELNKIDILNAIQQPMGRLILSMFATPSLEIYYPSQLSKRSCIILLKNRQQTLYMYARLMEIQKYKYLAFYLGAVYCKFFGKKKFDFKMKISDFFKKYIEDLQNHE